MPNVPLEVQKVLEQLEPILVRWYREHTVGEIAVVIGKKQMQPEERPKTVHEGVEFERADGRAKPVGSSKT